MNKITFGLYISFLILIIGVTGYYIYTGTKEGPKAPEEIICTTTLPQQTITGSSTAAPTQGPVKTYDPNQYYDQYGRPITPVSPTPTVKPTKPAKTTRPPIYRTYKPATEKPLEDEESDAPLHSQTPLPIRTPFPVTSTQPPYVTGFTLPPKDTDSPDVDVTTTPEPIPTPAGSDAPLASDLPVQSDLPTASDTPDNESGATPEPTPSVQPSKDPSLDEDNPPQDEPTNPDTPPIEDVPSTEDNSSDIATGTGNNQTT